MSAFLTASDFPSSLVGIRAGQVLVPIERDVQSILVANAHLVKHIATGHWWVEN